MNTHPHETMSGLRQRIAAAGIRVSNVAMTGTHWRGEDVGHVPLYTITLTREDGRTMNEEIATGTAPWEPDAFEVMDTLTTVASLVLNEGIGDSEESRAQIERTRRFVEGPDCWDDWLYYTDSDPGRQDDYDEEDS